LAQEVIANDGSSDEQSELHHGQRSQSLGEILWPLHFGNERRVEDLTNPQKGDLIQGASLWCRAYPGKTHVQGRIEAVGECSGWSSCRSSDRAKGRPIASVAKGWVIFNARVNPSQQKSNGHADCWDDGHLGDVVKGTRQRHDDGNDCGNSGENHSALRVIAERVEDFGTGEDCPRHQLYELETN
jgi:hypothetical protein